MSSWYFTRRRGEVLLSWLRLGVAILTTFAVLYDSRLDLPDWVDFVAFAYGIGAVLALAVGSLKQPTLQRRVAEHSFDVVLSLFFIVVAAGSPAVLLTHFALLVAAAAIRFRWTTVVLTIVLCVTAYIAAVLFGGVEEGGAATLINLIALALVGAAAALVTHLQERLRAQLSTVFDTRTVDLDDVDALYDFALSNVARAMDVPRLMAILYRGNESHCCIWTEDQLRINDVHASTWVDAFDDRLEHDDFFCNDLGETEVVTSSGESHLIEEPVSPEIASSQEMTSVLRIVLQGTFVRGSLILLDRSFNWDDLALGRLVADVFASRLDDHEFVKLNSTKAIAAERSRIARDLHDSLLQSLTGASLQLEGARRLVEERPAEAQQILRDVQDVLIVDQNELRYLVENLRQASTSRAVDLKTEVRFNAVVAMVRRQWGAQVDFNVPSLQAWVGKSERREVHRLLREAVFNAAKHSGAKHISVEGDLQGDILRLLVRNDGHGFAFRGRYDLAKLNEMKQGPATLKERVAALGGDLIIDSHEHGSELEIRLPIRRAGAVA
jgi:signal transduction histidine kinase